MAGRNTRRAVFLDLVRIQMPVGALTSITHRVTGILLVHHSGHALQGFHHLVGFADAMLQPVGDMLTGNA